MSNAEATAAARTAGRFAEGSEVDMVGRLTDDLAVGDTNEDAFLFSPVSAQLFRGAVPRPRLALQSVAAAGTRGSSLCNGARRRLSRPRVSPVIPKAPRTPAIHYVDDDAETVPLRGLDEASAKLILDRAALRGRLDTLMPIAADATVDRFVASDLDDSDADITARMNTVRERRVRTVARRAVVLTIAAALAILAVAALRSRPTQTLVFGQEHRNPRRDVGVLVVPDRKREIVFVDDARAGVCPEPIELACGAHRVRIGEAGSTRTVDVPCDGRIEL